LPRSACRAARGAQHDGGRYRGRFPSSRQLPGLFETCSLQVSARRFAGELELAGCVRRPACQDDPPEMNQRGNADVSRCVKTAVDHDGDGALAI
jgi:hypothetical protein